MTNPLAPVKHNEAIFMWMLLLLVPGSSAGVVAAPREARRERTGVLVNSTFNQLSPLKKATLFPKESVPKTGSYILLDPKGNVCIKTRLGIEYIATIAKSNFYFNINPSSVKTTGFCGEDIAVLSLNFDAGYIDFTFVKRGNISYVSTLSGSLLASANCRTCKSEQFIGAINNTKLFLTDTGSSYKCYGGVYLRIASNLKIKILHMQAQGFEIRNGRFGVEKECWSDYVKRVVIIILGGTAVGVFLIVVLIFLIAREHQTHGYERI